MKVVYYVTPHGLGHSSRTVAIARELARRKVEVIIRSEDRSSFLKKSLPSTRIIKGRTDFVPVMRNDDSMALDEPATQKNVSDWIGDLRQIIEDESRLVRQEQPDAIISDISVMPILLAEKHDIKSIAISNFAWSETLQLDDFSTSFLADAYSKADHVLKLPLGSPMNFPRRVNTGLVARTATESRESFRKRLGIGEDKKLITLAVRGGSVELQDGIEVIDVSNYAVAADFVEGQNLINASDLVICKCGYGFVSECLAHGIKFRYILEPDHLEASYIHRGLQEMGLDNRITAEELLAEKLDRLVETSGRLRAEVDNVGAASLIEDMIAGS
jgi:UDP:flavonoid glycosyltransferase YjiC (YdhE family)